MLIFLSAPHISKPNLLRDLDHFHLLSNLKKKNHTKNNALNFTASSSSVELYKKNFPFTWAKHNITYLGIKIPSNLENLFKLLTHTERNTCRLKEMKFLKRLMVWKSLPNKDDNFTPIFVCHADNPHQFTSIILCLFP